jgi:peptidoglycan/LPS O-acetylase OafA/YrhL
MSVPTPPATETRTHRPGLQSDTEMQAVPAAPFERTQTEAAGDAPRPGWESGGLRRFAALDGIRAFAVLAVLCYHAGISWVGGGLLGVDVFFVLSGFLITSLLCRELGRSGTVRLGRFWAQRARRLLPGLLILLIGVAVYAVVYRSTVDVGLIRGDALSTLAYVANWHFILADQGYFAQTAAPSPLLHTWSLAVEEQYYLVWPLVALLVVPRWGARALAAVAGVLALGSALLMGVLYALGASLDRLYFGTDTRIQALLVGSVLGAVGSHRGETFAVLPERWRSTPGRRRLWAVFGLVGAGYLVWAWHGLEGQSPSLYRGGFLVVALAAGAVIVGCVTAPASVLSRVLSVAPLVFVGRISYGLYLYHWPLFLVIDHARTGLRGAALLVVRLVVTGAVASASWYFVEEPIRTRALFRGRRALGLSAGAAALTAGVVVVATVAPAAGAVAPLRSAPLPAAEHQALEANHAFTTHPIRFVLTGDSVAFTLGLGLRLGTVNRYGVKVIDLGVPGCDLDPTEIRIGGTGGTPLTACAPWPSVFARGVRVVHPDVVGFLLGRWEVADHFWQGRWVHVGDPAWDAHLVAELDGVAGVFSSQGAKVVFFTSPYFDQPQEAADGSAFPEDTPARVDVWNQLLREAAARRSATVTVVDVNRLLDPSGHYQSSLDGRTVRSTDGIHITEAGGALIQRDVLPEVVRVGIGAASYARAS